MVREVVPDGGRPSVAAPGLKPALGLLVLLAVSALAFFAIRRVDPPAAVVADAPASEFSSGRALKHLQEIARRPRPVGSREHEKARDYILSELRRLGLSPQVQKTSAVHQRQTPPFQAATVENVVARLEGTEDGRAVALVGHYDTTAHSDGASDDGAAVAAMLETARAVKSGPALKEDVILLFTDAEEVGLLGARAFVAEHGWAKDVGVVLNFEARGNGGPSIMFETSPRNGWLIRQFAAAAPQPVANSLSADIYKLLPNDTDLTVFKEAGLAGLNFAYVDGITHYHTPLDNLENIDERSLQHHGSYALSLTRHFAGPRLPEREEGGDAVYFDVLGWGVVHYSRRWLIPLTLVLVLASAALVVVGYKRGLLRGVGVAWGGLALLLGLVLGPLTTVLAWWLVSGLHGGFASNLQRTTYHVHLYVAGFVALAAAVTAALYAALRNKISALEMLSAALWWWLLTLILSVWFVPGASYLFTWPVFFILVFLAYMVVTRERDFVRPRHLAVFLVCAIPAVVLLAPMVRLLLAALPLHLSWAVMLLVVLPLGFLLPAIGLRGGAVRWALPAALTLAGAACILAASFGSGFDRRRPKSNHVFYSLNADTQQAHWASRDPQADEWTSQFFAGGAEQAALTEYFPVVYTGLRSPARALALPAPQVELLGEEKDNDVRTVRLRVISPRQAPVVAIRADAETTILGASVNGKRIGRDGGTASAGWSLRYFALPPEGLELTLETKPSQPLKLGVMDQSYGLPELPPLNLRDRPDYMKPSPAQYSDSTLVSKSFTF